MTVSRVAIVQEARSWLHTPYRHQGRLKRVGVDCAGLVIGVARAVGVVAKGFDVNGYGRRPDGTTLIAHCERWMYRMAADAMRPGDVIVLRFVQDPQHMGVVADYYSGGDLSVIHALGKRDGRGKVVEHRIDATMLERFVAAYRMPGVE